MLDAVGLTPAFSAWLGTIDLRDDSGRTVLQYGALSAQDADGRSLEANLALDHGRIALHVRDESARYPIVIDPLVWAVPLEKLVASDGAASDNFGEKVAVEGTTLAVAAPNVASATGAVYVWTRAGSTWALQQKLMASDHATSQYFGWSLALSADTLAAGAPTDGFGGNGAGYVFIRGGATWTEQQKILASDGATGDSFGLAAAASGDTAVFGAPGRKSYTGAAYVFVRSGTTWTQQQIITAADAASGPRFGFALALEGDTLVVGAYQLGGNTGGTYVFVRSGTTWTQQAKLLASDGAPGDEFGTSVAISGASLAIGAPGKASHRGQAYVFVRSGTTWTEQGHLIAHDRAPNDQLGNSVAMHGDSVTAGAPGIAPSTGAVYTYVRSGTAWTEQKKSTATDGVSGDRFGDSLAMDATSIVVGVEQKDRYTGAAYVFVQAKANGDPCVSPTECVSGACVDGVCCESACTGKCEACSAAKKGTGTDGACGRITDGTDPDVECPGATCSGVTLENGHVCNGAGACRVTTTKACTPYACDSAGKSCLTTCASDAGCDPADFCSGTTCVAKKPAGSSCARTGECTTGFCVDGVCCDRSCTGTCEACSAAAIGVGGLDGTCALVGDGRPDAACPVGTCTAATATTHLCDGKGKCKTGSLACGALGCDASGIGCLEKCSGDGDCRLAGYCLPTGECAVRKDKGSTCSAANECKIGDFCVDGVCCDKSCDGRCEACDVSGAAGTCTAVSGSPHGKRSACTDDGKGCGGTCNGKASTTACTYPDATKTCGGCSGSKIARCDGKGGCGTPSTCPDSLTCDAEGKCRDHCTVADDCIPGYGCSAGTCAPKGNNCSADRHASIDSSGKSTVCEPILCDVPSGICGAVCNSQSDCKTGTSCASNKQCVADDAAPSDSGGCGIEPAASGKGGTLAGLGAWLALAAMRRRRRRLGRTVRTSIRARLAARFRRTGRTPIGRDRVFDRERSRSPAGRPRSCVQDRRPWCRRA